jgi:putative membrane protein
MSMRKLMAWAAGVMALGAGHISTLEAQETSANESADQQFINRLAAENLLEVRLGQTAEKNGSSAAVKQFAQQMVSDHTAMQKQWMALASKNDLDFKAEWSPEQTEQAERLRAVTGADFDRAYMGLTVQNHAANVSAFENEQLVAHSPEVRNFMARDLALLQNHLRQAREIGRQVGADVSGGVATTPAAPSPADTTIVTQNPPRADTTIVAQNPQADPRGADRQRVQEQATQGNIRADAQFIRNVDAHHYLQVRLGRLAQKKGRDSAVKRFGERMEEDHGALQQQLNNVASRNGMKFESGMGPDNRANLERLEKVSDKAFDRAYMTLMIQTHNGYLNYWRKEGRAARSAPVRQLVNRGLPTLEEHMEMAKRIGSRIGVDADAALVGRRIASERSDRGTVIE